MTNSFCPRCGHLLPPPASPADAPAPCPACGAPAPAASGETPDIRREAQRRATLTIAALVTILVAVLLWFLLQPSGSRSGARSLKNALFGPRVTRAVEDALAQRQGSGSGSGSGQGGAGQGRSGSSARGDAASGAETGNGAGRGDSGDDAREGGRGRSGADPGEGPGNVQLENQADAGIDAPPERSLGWLDRFFRGGSESDDLRAGDGGTGTQAGAGNDQTPATPPPEGERVASELTRAEPTPPLSPTYESPRELPRTTNRAVNRPTAEISDTFERLLRQHHAGTGDLRVSLMWNNRNDLDLHVIDPTGYEITYRSPKSPSGGELDIDMNARSPLRSPAVENVVWPRRAPPKGRYRVYVNHYQIHQTGVNDTPFTVRVLIRGRTQDFPGTVKYPQGKKLVHEFVLQ